LPVKVSSVQLLIFTGATVGWGCLALAKDQEFRFDKPDAQRVDLMCECQNWQAQSMSKASDGIWTITLSLSPGSYGYKFLVNGSDWVFDPNNPNRKNRKRNREFGD